MKTTISKPFRVATVAPEWFIAAALLVIPSTAWAEPSVEFDFPKLIACRDVTPAGFSERNPKEKVVEAVFPVSIRIHGNDDHKVQEISLEIDGGSAGLRVVAFAPQTHLESELADNVIVETTTVKSHSIDATLGGQLPVPYAEVVAKVTPSISAGRSQNKIATEKTLRLPPKLTVVVSGTRNQGQGVFFELKPTSQTTLEGVHELSVSFVVPKKWQTATVRVSCSARGQRQVLWLDQNRVWGQSRRDVGLYLVGDAEARELAEVALSNNNVKRAQFCSYVLFSRPKPVVNGETAEN
jgi:hypothetical protein